MIPLSELLLYYKRRDIQDEIVKHAKEKEIAVRFGEKGFGKRPDTLQYANDILELVKQGATSFHASEELWKNPLRLDTSLKKQELDELRKGWDLVIDIDCPHWNFSKLITWLVIKTLKDKKVKSISVKFSGNKGFHIGVPFEAFPKKIGGKETALLFPEYAQKIALHILNHISENYIHVKEDNSVEFEKGHILSLKELLGIATKESELIVKRCKKCNKIAAEIKDSAAEFICPKCESRLTAMDEDYKKCPKCNFLMQKMKKPVAKCSCGSTAYEKRFNPLSIVKVDTILISSRHLYRMPYSMHEKSGLVSIPIDPEKVLNFEKDAAKPKNVAVGKFVFLGRENIVPDEAKSLFLGAEASYTKEEERKKLGEGKENKEYKDFDSVQQAIPEDFFPPCIKNILKGLEDGKKRALFILMNFLTSVGWDYDKIEGLLKEWNKRNKEQLREVLIVGHLRYHKQHKKKVLPPNCQNSAYYKDMQMCVPDALCARIKNPVQYSRRKTFYLNQEGKKKGKRKKPAEQQDLHEN